MTTNRALSSPQHDGAQHDGAYFLASLEEQSRALIAQARSASPEREQQWAHFCLQLNQTLGQALSEAEVSALLAQHLVIKPLLEALFSGFPFTEHNAIARHGTRYFQLFLFIIVMFFVLRLRRPQAGC